jgi:hypothetical protein
MQWERVKNEKRINNNQQSFGEGHCRQVPQVFAELNNEHPGGDGFPRASHWWQRKSVLSRIFGFIAAVVSIFVQRIRIGLRWGPPPKSTNRL